MNILNEVPWVTVPFVLQSIDDYLNLNKIVNRLNPMCEISIIQMDTIKGLQHSLREVNALLKPKFDLINYMLATNNDYLEQYLIKNKEETEYLCSKVNEYIQSITFIVINLSKKVLTLPKIKEDIFGGTEWLRELFSIYLKYNTETNVTPLQFFKNIKTKWDMLSDNETIIISDITENKLGGKSLFNISCNFKDWIISNKDAMPQTVIKLEV